MYIRFIVTFFLFVCSVQPNLAQGVNNIWLTGYSSLSGYPNFDVSTIDFFSGSASVTSTPMEMEFEHTHTNMSDFNGNLLFYTNGYYIADASGDTMLNGSGINPSIFTSNKPSGLNIPQSALFIPYPDSSNKYIFFHSTIDELVPFSASYFYYSTIDMNGNGGYGEVILKNQIIISDTLNPGKIAAVKHGNGRDWWVLCHKLNSNSFYRILITPNGIGNPTLQSIGINRPADLGQAWFSPDGNTFAYYFTTHGLEIFDFDRCTGILSSPIHKIIDNNEGSGIAFSPNSTKLYASAGDTLYQYDLTATNVLSSQTIVAVYDSFTSGIPTQLPTFFELMALAPDGKIYITTGNSTFHYHVIDQPDSLGTACNVIQHGLNLNHYYFNTLPNHPNYHLGPLVGSICDSITGIPPSSENLTLKLYPNPNAGSFQITYTPVPENLTLQVINILGEVVHSQLLPQWSQLQNISISNLGAGIYFAKLSSTVSSKSIKFVVE